MPRDLVQSIIKGRKRLKQKQEAHMVIKSPSLLQAAEKILEILDSEKYRYGTPDPVYSFAMCDLRRAVSRGKEEHMQGKSLLKKAVSEKWPHVRIIVKSGTVQEVKCWGNVTYEVVDHDVR